MSDVYVIRNQLGHYWGKGKAWVDGTEPKTVLRVKHEDEAVNTLFELSSRDFDLRGEVVAVQLTEKGEPVIEPSEHLLPREDPQAAMEVPVTEASAGESTDTADQQPAEEAAAAPETSPTP